MGAEAEKNQGLVPHIGKMGAWSLAMGTSIGWGSLVVTANSYLNQAGPWGSVIGLIIGALVMIVMSRNYHYMVNCFPENGGAYIYAREVFGYDHGFLSAWFLFLTYAAVFWANATSLPLFSRYFIGDVFRFGKLYTIFGYDVYIGEALLTIAGIFIFAALCMRFRKALMTALIIMVILFTLAITIAFIAAMTGIGNSSWTMDPAFIPDKPVIEQVIRIACISPWAFIGFENMSNLSGEFSFDRKKVFRIMTLAIVVVTILYIFIFLLSTTAYPEQYSGWMEYIGDIGNLSGIEGLPAFYAAYRYMGGAGIAILMIALLCLVLTSLIGNMLALSRLLYAVGKDEVIPKKFAALNKHHIPGNAVLLMAVISLIIPFLGRTAIGWIVDVTTIGTTLVYGYVSACSFKLARMRGDRRETATGLAGLILMLVIAGYLFIPNLFSPGMMERESYFLFVVWGIVGFIAFRVILHKDKAKKFGQSIIVWIALLAIVLFISLIWMRQSMMNSADRMKVEMHEYVVAENLSDEVRYRNEELIDNAINELESSNSATMLVVAGLFGFSLLIMFANFSYLNNRTKASEKALKQTQEIAYKDPLTGVKSKNAYVEMEHTLNTFIREGSENKFAIVVCDVNGLKYINDNFGHKAGDDYIRSAAEMICGIFKRSPVFRTGGDEFVVILEGRDYNERKNLLRALNQHSENNIGSREAVVAAGLADFDPEKDARVHDVFERADVLMYENKNALKQRGAVTRG